MLTELLKAEERAKVLRYMMKKQRLFCGRSLKGQIQHLGGWHERW
jgi:hypothetical protein